MNTHLWDRYKIALGLFILIILSSIISPDFTRLTNIQNVVQRISIMGILAIGMTFVILSGGIDLSVGSVLAASACLTAGAIKYHNLPPGIAILIGLLGGAFFGFLNGIFITKGRMQPFVITLAIMTSARGFAFLYTNGQPITLEPSEVPLIINLGLGKLGGLIPVQTLIFAIVAIGAHFVLRYTSFGRYVYGLGGNEEAVRLSGVNVEMVKIFIYTISGMLAGLGGILMVGFQNGLANANFGMGYELSAIACVVIGGTSLAGGIGGVGNTVIGTLIIGILDNILNLKGVGTYVQEIVRGAIIIFAVYISKRKE
ncbi:ABC transporter permease [bacterium]|nr:ABC transporter permease [bacterium]